MMLYDSIIPCFGSRFTIVLMPDAQSYRVFPLGTFHFFDWQTTDRVGVSIGTCPQIVTSETARIGVRTGTETRVLPFSDGQVFAHLQQHITPLTTVFSATDPQIPVSAAFTFSSAFYPQNFEYSCAPGYCIEIQLSNVSDQPVTAEVFFGLSLPDAHQDSGIIHSAHPIIFPDSIDHAGIDNLTFEQAVVSTGAESVESEGYAILRHVIRLIPGQTECVHFFHSGYIAQPSLNRQGDLLRFGYTSLWDNARTVATWWQSNLETIKRRGNLFESTVIEANVPVELKSLLSAAFKGLASNSWWAERDWFSVMEIGAYHSTLDVDYQLALFFFLYWPDLIQRMLNQWADYYTPGSGYMAHDVGQHLEATGNRYGGPGSAMKVEENCNYIILLHHYWRVTGDESVLHSKRKLVEELCQFLIASDTTGSGLPNLYADNTNDWGSGLITTSEEQSYHGVRLIAALSALAEIATFFGDEDWCEDCLDQIRLINDTLDNAWQGDHYPIALSDAASFHHYSMWTTHGLLYPLCSGMNLDINLERMKIDLISSTCHTMREHGSVHSTVDVRGWLTQNLWRDSIAAYLGIEMTANLQRYLGHGEYVSYEDTTILEVANELMIVPGAIAGHTHPGETHDFPMVDGHPRPACGFGLLYALAGIQYNAQNNRIICKPVVFPLRIALTHAADWVHEEVPWVSFQRTIPNQDGGHQPSLVTLKVENEHLLAEHTLSIKAAH